MQLSFGSGVIWSVPVLAVNNNAAPSGIGGGAGGAQNYATVAWENPVRMGILQDFSIEYDLPTKVLHGQGVYPLAVARGKGKVPIKIRNARLSALALNALVFGDDTNTITTPAGFLIADLEAATIPATPYQVTVANSATWTRDLGVVVQSTDGRFSRAASATGSGVYSVASGVYTFNSADAGVKVFVDYEYQPASVAPYRITINQQKMGATPVFMLTGMGDYQGKQLGIQLNYCMIGKAMFNFKLEDFLIPELDGEAFADAITGSLGNISTAEL
jgi:hypothetical protein